MNFTSLFSSLSLKKTFQIISALIFFLFAFIFSESSNAQLAVEENSWNFIAIGDTGKANSGQYKVGKAIADDCIENNCQFGLLLGDNFYEVGVESADDPQFVEKFEKPYKDFPVPFYVALGNHDYGKLAREWGKAKYQRQYALKNPKFKLPYYYYSFTTDDVLFIVLDTTRLFHDNDTQKQVDFIKKTLRENKRKWTVVVSHHPYISNGKHGNAGLYDRVPIPPFSGSVVKRVFEKYLCKVADLVLTGHDHNLQTLPGTKNCKKPIFVVSGTGASVDDNLTDRNPAFFQASVLGYTNVHVNQNSLFVDQKDENGDVLHRQVISK